MTSIIYKGKQDVIGGGGGFLFEDKCDSATLPSGVTTTGTVNYSSGRYWTVTGSYIMPITGVLSDNPCCFANVLHHSTLGFFQAQISVNGVVRYNLAFQDAGNLVLYRLNPTSVPWTPGFINQASENWKFEIVLNQANIHARAWRDTSFEVSYSPLFNHTHFTANPSDSVQFRLIFDVAGGQSSKLKYARVDTKPLQWGY